MSRDRSRSGLAGSPASKLPNVAVIRRVHRREGGHRAARHWSPGAGDPPPLQGHLDEHAVEQHDPSGRRPSSRRHPDSVVGCGN